MPVRTEAERGADIVLRGFEEFHDTYRSITRRVVERFEERDWEGIRRDTVRRLTLHRRSVGETLGELRDEIGDGIDDREVWVGLKEAYSLAVLGRDDFELAQTFHNSLTRRVFAHAGIDPGIDYLSRDFPLPFKGWEMSNGRMYAVHRPSAAVFRRVLLDAGLRARFRDLDGAAGRAARAVEEALSRREMAGFDALDFLEPVFIRNKAAYIIGRVRKNGETVFPVVLALLHTTEGLELDATVTDTNQTSILFSFASWYFHAVTDSPRHVIGFLHSLMPRKRIAELYISLGYNKHGKSEFYGDLVQRISGSVEQFVSAPGQRGLVMAVFTLPSFEFVFKVIRDRFPSTKSVTRREVLDRYRQVLLHDRVGRLVDFQEFEYLEFPRARFSDQVLTELLEECGESAELRGDDVLIRHLFVGRRVTPLDLYLRQKSPELQREAVVDWGHAIKELAAADLFPGDMLLKNFGVTRHGRVVFYDYDEVRSLAECKFRKIPEAEHVDQELDDQPWFSVRPGDVFPEEFERFLGLDDPLREAFLEHHADLLTSEMWNDIQDRNRRGEIIDFFPYAS